MHTNTSSLLAIFVIVFVPFANAITFNSHFDIIYPKSKDATITIKNESKKLAHIVSVSVHKINSPYERKLVDSRDFSQVTFTPTKQLLQPGAQARFKFIYNGPQDSKERYYEIRWLDSALSRANSAERKHLAGSVNVNTTVATTLIVNPRKSDINITLKGSHVVNYGNTMVDFFINAKCREDESESCSLQKPFFPGDKIDIGKLKLDDISAGHWTEKGAAQLVNLIP